MGKINVHQMLKDKFLLIEDDRTIECHTHLVKEVIKEIVESAIDLCVKEVKVGVAKRNSSKIKGSSSKRIGIMNFKVIPDKDSILAVKNMINYE